MKTRLSIVLAAVAALTVLGAGSASAMPAEKPVVAKPVIHCRHNVCGRQAPPVPSGPFGIKVHGGSKRIPQPPQPR